MHSKAGVYYGRQQMYTGFVIKKSSHRKKKMQTTNIIQGQG